MKPRLRVGDSGKQDTTVRERRKSVMKTPATVFGGLLLVSMSLFGGDYLSFVECHEGESELEYYRDGAIDVGGSMVTVVGFYDEAAHFSRDPETGKLNFVENIAFSSSGTDLEQVLPGRFLYLARGYSDMVTVIDRANDGSLSLLQNLTDGQDGVDGIENTMGVCLPADGHNVYAVGKDDDAIAVFTRNSTDGTLSFLEAHFDTDTGIDGLDGAMSCVVSPDDDFVYVGSGEDDAIAVFRRDAATGALTYTSMISNADTGVSGLGYPVVMKCPPHSSYLYVSGDGVAVFSRDAVTGELSFVQRESMAFPYSMTYQAGAGRLYVASQTGDSVTVYEIDDDDGTLTEVETLVQGSDGMTCLDSPAALFLSPGGGSLYVGGENGSLAVFSIAIFGNGFETGDTAAWE